MIDLILEVWQYIKTNPLELPAFIISFLVFLYTRKIIKVSYAKINLEIIYSSLETWHQLKIYSPEKGQSLFIKEIPKIYKRKFGVYKKLNYLVDYNYQIDKETKEPIQNIYYIHLGKLSNLEKGNYMIKVHIDILPYVLKYRFTLPLIAPLQNPNQLIG